MKKIISFYGIQDCNDFTYPCFTHDHSICIGADGKVIGYLQLERYTRRKYDNRLNLFIDDMLTNKTIDIDDDDIILSVNNFLGQSFLSSKGIIRIEPLEAPSVNPLLIKAKTKIVIDYEQKDIDSYIVPHEIAHVFTNLIFYGEFNDNSLIIHFDGGASLGNMSVYIYRNGVLNLKDYGWKWVHLSKLYNNNALVFKMVNASPGEHCSVPGKFMGLASIGIARKEIIEWLVKNKFFENIWDKKGEFYDAVEKEFGIIISEIDNKDPFIQDVAASFQEYFVEEATKNILLLNERYRCDYLYLSGGAALNIKLNSRLIAENIFKNIYAPPCCNDSGLSLGAFAFYCWLNKMKISNHTAYLNNLFCDLKDEYIKQDYVLIKKVADILCKGGIIGVANGNGEAGPRALGNRSILAIPNSIELKNKVSVECKGREWYRPVAPVMLEKNAQYYTGLSKIDHLSRYMLLDFNIKKELIPEITGVVHFDGSSRIQTIFSRNENPFVYDLLNYLDEAKKIKALINTSFNRKGEPIVHTRDQAIESAKNMRLDAVVVDNKLMKLY